ncbi:S8 family serine peptidase [Miltoncostaea marina]|uniref:S8 family serine peptidase n=1 Tax=Miltoncostaea marina TaxID=2843215 RepID=UPI001C3E3808|nr:S8 family serine peptidase [Miltoncostaea marina]
MTRRAVLALLAAGLAAPATASAQDDDARLVVGLHDGAGPAARAALEARAGVDLGRVVTARGARVATVRDGRAEEALARLRGDPAVRWAEPDRPVRAAVVPADPLFGSQWGLRNTGQAVGGSPGAPGADIGAAAAWDRTTGDARVRIAVIDGGVEAGHPDLAAAMPGVNPGEMGGGREANGRDDDGNGRVDDWRGWDFVAGDADPRDEDTVSHGTAVAGVIAARGGDGVGVAGVAWAATLIPVRAMEHDGTGTSSAVAAAVTYAAERGARIINLSLGGAPSNAIREAIASAPDALVIAAAGNGRPGLGGNVGFDVDASPVHPCALPLENVVCVTATGPDDRLAPFANHGDVAVDLAAPGVEITAPRRGGGWTPMTGTSFAAPHAAGVAALVLAANPGASTRQLRRALLDGAQPVAALAGRVATGGRLSAPGALAAVPPAGRAPAAPPARRPRWRAAPPC